MQNRKYAATEKTKKGRKSTHFTDNVTASLALPTTDQQPNSAAAAPKTDYTGFQMMYHFYSMASDFLRQTYPSRYLPNTIQLFSYLRTPVDTQPKQITEAPNVKPIKDEATQKIIAIKHHIKEHAERRVDLFFYLLIAVYNKQVIIEKDKTIQQNGRGSSENKTQACHSSLFPNITMRPIEKTPSLWQSLWQSISRQVTSEAICPSLAGTQFMESLNSTVELPKMVNDFDGKLEGRGEKSTFVDGFLIILNKAAKGEIDPRQGMNDFFKLMEVFFNHYDKKKKNIGAMRKVWEYQKEGTFKAANKDMTLRDDYLHMMLRIHPANSNKVKLFSYFNKESALRPHFKKIQDEIFGSSRATLKK